MIKRVVVAQGIIPMARNRIKSIAKKMLLGIGVLIVLSFFTLPLTFYYIYEYANINRHSIAGPPATVNTSFVPDDDCDTSLKWLEQQYSMNYTADEDSAECTSNEYGKGGVCEEVLLEWTHCTLTNYSYIPISVPYETTLNDNIKGIFELLNSFPDCQSQAIPFLCQYYYPLVDCVNDVIYTTSKEECTSIISTVCSVPWSLAELAGINGLPNCELLQGSRINGTNYTSTNNSTLVCKDDFFEADGVCVPHCEQIHIGPQFFSTFQDICQIIYFIIIIVLIIIAMIYSFKEWKKTFRFPTLFVVFMITNLGVAGIADSVAYFVGPKLFCKKSNLLKSIRTDPTTYCLIDGVIIFYTLLSATIWWFIHLSILVFRVAFPFKAKQLNDYKRCTLVYCLLTVGGFLSPIPGIIVALTTDENHFRITYIPPRRCSPPATWGFYFLVLPISVVFAIGVLFLCYIIKAINKIRSNVSRRRILGPGERKLLVFVVLFLVFGEYSMIYLTMLIINKDELLNATATYFKCEAIGHTPGKCSTDVLGKWFIIFFIMEKVFYLLLIITIIGIAGSFFDWQKYCKKCFKKKNHGFSLETRKNIQIPLI